MANCTMIKDGRYVVEKHRLLIRISEEPFGKRAGPIYSCCFRAWLLLNLRSTTCGMTFKRVSGVIWLMLLVRSLKAVFFQNVLL